MMENMWHRRAPDDTIRDTWNDIFNHKPEVSPEKELWFSVVEMAIVDLQRAPYKRALNSSYRWFMSDAEGIGTFNFCCEVLEMDSQFLRKRVMEFYEREVASNDS
jgi:hypothetical protein